MAIGWISLLSALPWKDVISSAPAVADSAKKLWNTVTKKVPLENIPTFELTVGASTDSEVINKLLDKLNEVDATVIELQKQMLASSELIKALADQNTALIKRVEVNRIRLKWVSGAVAILVVIAAVAIKIILNTHAVDYEWHVQQQDSRTRRCNHSIILHIKG